MTNTRPSHRALVRTEPEGPDPAQKTQRIVIGHHRAPRVAWSLDVASGGHVLHLSLAQCVFNNILRIAAERGVAVQEVAVAVDGDFNEEGTASTGIDCSIELAGAAARTALISLAEAAFDDSTVAAVLRRAGSVELTSVRATSVPAQPAG